ncbi:SDR family oxidoreductase [Nocardia ignorata]|uniref:SDR family oxidoreductase n=1 Tax=Nocardia ignorata TaxID=145285 RepID=UPI00363B5BD2
MSAPRFSWCKASSAGSVTVGRIVNLSSAVTRLAIPDIPAYTMAKGAIDSFTRVLAQALGPRGTTVNAVAPGVCTHGYKRLPRQRQRPVQPRPNPRCQR